MQEEPEVRSDIYALAATMHHLLSGRPPVPFKFPAIRSLRSEVSAEMEALLEKALKLRADERYGTAREMKEALEGFGAASTKAKAKAALAAVKPSPAVAAQSPAPSLPPTMINTKDGADMILISAGKFLMGSPAGKGSDDEHPQHKVFLDAFYICKYQVTNGQFARFVKETGYNAEGDWKKYAKSGRETHPVVNVTWNDASAYCRWGGGALPTEAQWEKAARGIDGREYPWGNTWDGNRCNWDKGPKVSGMADIYSGRGTVPVGSFPSGVSPYGVYDMAGNVWEWCSDWYDKDYYRSSPLRNPEGPGNGGLRVIRGGCFIDDSDDMHSAIRDDGDPTVQNVGVGFRLVLKGGASAPAKAKSKPKAAQSQVGSILAPAKAAPAPVKPAPAVAAQSHAPSLPPTMTNPKDGADMILIPAGEFLMGSPAGKGSDDEHPQHKVFLDAFYICKYQVTNGQFARFVKETGYNAEGDWKKYAKSGRETHPVVNVTWNDASAYCRWGGGALPTEAQWEKAARGIDGREYPWGNTWDGNRCNWKIGPKIPGMAVMWDGKGTVPVGSFPSGVSPYGVHDMAGNVWEWCSDWYDKDYYKSSPSRNPEGPGNGDNRVFRGGCFIDDSGIVRSAFRGYGFPSNQNYVLGFRLVLAGGVSAPAKAKSKPEAAQSPVRPAPSLPPTMKNPKDGADMILIPAGDLLMGSPAGKGDERPQHKVYLDAFYIYKYQVTNGQFARFVRETGYKAEGDWKRYANSGRETHPVVFVTWNDASAYCRWAGGALPTEAQWEMAARGPDGREYPWGNIWDGNRCNWYKGPKVSGMADIWAGRGTVPVGSFPSGVSPYGVHDMAGNVWEWCSDWYNNGVGRVLRGGSFGNGLDYLRSAFRLIYVPSDLYYCIGFRLVRAR